MLSVFTPRRRFRLARAAVKVAFPTSQSARPSKEPLINDTLYPLFYLAG